MKAIIVDLNVGHLNSRSRPSCLKRLQSREDAAGYAWEEASILWTRPGSQHCVRFASAGLTVCTQASVVTLNGILNDLRTYGFIDSLLISVLA